ncbi:tripartite tricarboxylate transporter TctB family protein [Salinicola endophyticus]|uniref:Tripartite tricarboxylate transporter TctB family protein n=1 Tax=Salinicola endophyticus TaxID=1949083 RepID=A0ABY8FIU0_9GAMM|nr:tripartite tricarboxylate transporter TctB family protein [Salinicola endophyticus]WFF41965.1 tripartite tricarboxylate transporter TctB family protein [Salinicola endophyticus]
MSADSVPAAAPTGPAADGTRGAVLANLLFNLALGALFAALFVDAGDLPSSMWEPLGAGAFPRLVLGTLILFNLALALQAAMALGQARRGAGTLAWLYQRRLAFATLAAFSLYALAMPWLGFPLASLSFLLAVQWLLGARRGRRLLVAAIVAVAFGLGLYLLFGQVFQIPLPTGRLW